MINILKMVKIELGKRDFGWIGLLIVLVGVGFVYGFGTGNPAVFGHSAGEISVDDAFCKKITGHGCGFDADTNAASICEDNKYLKGDGTCVAGKNVLDGNTMVTDDFCKKITGHGCGFDKEEEESPWSGGP